MILASTSSGVQTLTLDTFLEQISDFIAGVISLDPQQAALRAGLTALVVLGAALLIWGLRVILKALTERVAPDQKDKPAGQRVRIGRWSLRLARIVIVVAALLIVLRLWGFDYTLLRSSPVGAIFAAAIRIALIVFVALAALELCQLAIGRVFARIAERARTPRRAAQIRTLAPLLSGVAATTLILVAAMMALSEVGVEIGPLIAGAGIVGLAVGFGAQTLVKDFLTGIFLILEDTVSIGDVVRIGEWTGAVEEMSLRTIKLRDFDGTLHVFPYSEAQVIHNQTKTFSYAVFELQLSFLTDIDRAIAVTRATAESLAKDSHFAHSIIAPVEIVGVDAITDNAVVIKGRIKTRPGDHMRVRRAFNQRIKEAFDAEGVLIEHRHFPTAPYDTIADRIAPGQ
jgi:small conductance mechanosensitive channel